MKYTHSLFEGRLIRRYKRFMADIELSNGVEITAHCPNTGSMKNCLYPGGRVWYSSSANPKRKYPFTWEQAEIPVMIDGKEQLAKAGLNTARANPLVEELLVKAAVPELCAYDKISREVKYGKEGSRIDFLLKADQAPDCYVEVKSVTLAVGDGLGLFPDAITARGVKHLRELIRIKQEGKRAVLFFCVQHTGINKVSPAEDIDPEYTKTLRKAALEGVEIIAWRAIMSVDDIALTKSIPVLF
ncbi:MAG: DNA/RNA nuclease SfsA [Endozoicomonas sp. (ex Botrylloides leachii)]|nr:DNA/RNA nuclease SfsA [Endozoicomonas sp. (ex Botrylloides leachii)]